jgi:hypothetical protein
VVFFLIISGAFCSQDRKIARRKKEEGRSKEQGARSKKQEARRTQERKKNARTQEHNNKQDACKFVSMTEDFEVSRSKA